MRVGYLGPAGTHTEEAVKAAPGSDAFELTPLATVYDTVVAVQAGEVDRALVPIENSTEGAVNATLDALALETPDVVIVGEVVQRIDHCLLARAPVDLAQVTAVLSHPQASAQSARFLRAQLPNAVVLAAASTADAVRQLTAEEPAAGIVSAALGTRMAAEHYGAVVLRASVQDRDDNQTRFVWLARRDAATAAAGTAAAEQRAVGTHEPGATGASRPQKTSLVFWGVGADTPGWLVRCLSEFAFRGVNLTHIESRPRKQGLGSYMFFVDAEGSADAPDVAEAIAALHGHASLVRVLGSYSVAGSM